MTSPKMLVALPVLALLQALGVNAGSMEEIMVLEVVPRDAAPALLADAVGVFSEERNLVARQNPAACTFVLSAISFCSSVSPGFLSYAPSSQAPCLCYSSTSWVPGVFDGAISSCASYAKTSATSIYSDLTELSGFCSSVGNVKVGTQTTATTTSRLSAAASTSVTPTASGTPTITSKPATTSTGIAINPGCSTVSQLLNSCITASKGFTDLPINSQAACLCYSSSSWVPGSFDNGVQTCAEYVKTAASTAYSAISGLGGFCTAAGDVLAASAVNTGSSKSLTGGGVVALTNTGTGATAPVLSTKAPTATATAANTDPVTVIASPTASRPSSGAEKIGWNGMVFGIASVAISAVVFL